MGWIWSFLRMRLQFVGGGIKIIGKSAWWERKKKPRVCIGISGRGHSGLRDHVLVAAAFFSGRERPIDASRCRYPSVTVCRLTVFWLPLSLFFLFPSSSFLLHTHLTQKPNILGLSFQILTFNFKLSILQSTINFSFQLLNSNIN